MALKHFDFSRMNLPDRCLSYFFSENVVAIKHKDRLESQAKWAALCILSSMLKPIFLYHGSKCHQTKEHGS